MSNINAFAKQLDTSNDGSIVEITLTNSSTNPVGPFIATAIYQGTSTQYVWSEHITSIAASGTAIFDLSIDNEASSYSAANLHLGIAFTH
jgi:hypothetical protein